MLAHKLWVIALCDVAKMAVDRTRLASDELLSGIVPYAEALVVAV
jgi:hypothetical protein